MKNPILILLFVSIFCWQLSAQGDKFFNEGKYEMAVAAYKDEVALKPEKNMNLAKSLFAIRQYDKALDVMKTYITSYPKADTSYANWFIRMMERPESEVPMHPLAGKVNTSGTEAVPRISADGKRLYFKGMDRSGGFGGEDIWYAQKEEDGSWGEPILFSELSTNSHETMYAMSADGRIVVLFGNYPGSFGGGDLFYSVKTAEGWSFPCNLGGGINTREWEAQAALSPDGQTLIYASSTKGMKGHKGNSDLYVSRLTPNGWTEPVNLGGNINTGGFDIRPSFAADGKTLYFSSDGHKGFGGSDIFMSKRLDDSWTKWSKPVNLGRYINTLQDDEDISVNTSGTIGYTVKRDHKDAAGGQDIFQFVMPEIARPEQTITLYGFVTDDLDSAAAVNLRFTAINENKPYTAVPSFDKDGSYSVNLPFRKFLMEIDMKGFLYHSEIIDFSDPSKFLPKASISDKIGTEAARSVDSLMAIIHLNYKKLEQLNKSKSLDIKTSFDEYEQSLKNSIAALEHYKKIISTRKYAWLSEEKKYVDVRKDFKVQRASEGVTFNLENIFFDLGQATLKAESKPALDELHTILTKNDIAIELGGHTDSIGSDENNMQLSQQRVNSVKKYLEDKGIATHRINAVGYGESVPLSDNKTEEGRARNRRVEVKIIDNIIALREGAETELVEKKDVKEKGESAVLQPISTDFDMLSTLLAAAKMGGLPAGSECGDGPRYTSTLNTYTNTANTAKTKTSRLPKVKSPKLRSGANFSSFDKTDYIFKGFNVGYENFAFANSSAPLTGFNMRISNRKNLESDGLVKEHNFIYYLGDEFVNGGIGYQYMGFVPLKHLVGIPIGALIGVETRYFLYDETADQKNLMGYAGLPLGLRGLINFKGIIINPDAYYHVNLVTSDVLQLTMGKSNYLAFGTNIRWKLLYGGVQINMGSTVDYVGLRAGLSL